MEMDIVTSAQQQEALVLHSNLGASFFHCQVLFVCFLKNEISLFSLHICQSFLGLFFACLAQSDCLWFPFAMAKQLCHFISDIMDSFSIFLTVNIAFLFSF